MRRWRAWAVVGAAVVGGALLQGASAVPGYHGTDHWAFLVAAIGSLLVLVVETILIAWSITAIARREEISPPEWSLVGWAAIVAVAAFAVVAFLPYATPLVWTLAIMLLPAAALGSWNAFRGFTALAHHPIQAVLATLVLIVTGALGVGVAFASGFFLTGFLGAIAAWAWMGVIGALLMAWWAHLLTRSRRSAPS